jgi:hypothetical protein
MIELGVWTLAVRVGCVAWARASLAGLERAGVSLTWLDRWA